MLWIAFGLAIVVGVIVSLLGGGGTLLTVPILTYGLGFEAKSAITTSLIVVAATSAVAFIGNLRSGHLKLKLGLVFGASSMLGAYVGGRVSKYIPGEILLVMFGGLMLITALAMLRQGSGAAVTKPVKHWVIFAEGVLVGAITGLVGAGGGFLVVPALMLFGGLNMRQAVATSLMVVGMNSVAAVAGHWGHVQINWGFTLAFTVLAIFGIWIGLRFTARISQGILRRLFALFVLAVGYFMVSAELVKAGFVNPLAAGLGALAMATALCIYLCLYAGSPKSA